MKHLQSALAAFGLVALSSAAAGQVVNIAPGGTASQSSDYVPWTIASLANDGNTNDDYHVGSVQHTNDGINAWWRVDFAAEQEMWEVRLHNRGDCDVCGERLSNFRVSVFQSGSEVWGANFYTGTGSVPLGGVETVLLPAGIFGDAVQVQFLGRNNQGNGYLHMAEVEIFGPEVGRTHCLSNPNSTGVVGEIRGTGTALIGSNNFHLIASQVPPGQFGFFVASPTPGQIPVANSAGILCLGGPYARFDSQILQTAPSGLSVGTHIDVTAIPLTPMVSVQPGETWYFQYWHRDSVGLSNFTNGLMATFQ